jgi:Flp pilus assembly protein protease CpaA
MTFPVLAGLYVGVLVVAMWTDLSSRRIPNWLTLPALGIALVVAAASGNLASALAGALFAGGLFVLPAILYGAGAAGGGDVKLAAFVGASLGLSGRSRHCSSPGS